jgi:predicted DNA-binding transcriptional regulator YafY
VKQTGVKFEKDPKFSIRDELGSSFGVHSGTGKYKVVLRFSAKVSDYIREKRWHATQQLRELKDGGVELQMTLSALVEVERWILAWGGDAQVVGPKALKDKVRISARTILEVNGADDAE